MASPAVTNPQQNAESLHPFHGPWLSALIAELQASAGDMRYFVSSVPGNATATGSPGDPFNPTSAAASFGGDPFGQAIAAIPAPTTAAEEDGQWLIVAYGGAYPNPAVLDNAVRQLAIVSAGTVVLPAGSTCARTVAAAAFGGVLPPAMVLTAGLSGIFFLDGTITIEDGGAGIQNFLNIFSFQQTTGGVTVGGSGLTGSLTVQVARSEFAGAWNLPTASLDKASESTFGGDMTLDKINAPERCSFDRSITVTTEGEPFFDCNVCRNGSRTFTGPAGAAAFDPDSAASFQQGMGNENAFAGGCGLADYYNPADTFGGGVNPMAAGTTTDVDFVAMQQRTLIAGSAWVYVRQDIAGTGSANLELLLNGASLLAAPFDLKAAAFPALTRLTYLNPPIQLAQGDILTYSITAAAGITGSHDIACQVFMRPDERDQEGP